MVRGNNAVRQYIRRFIREALKEATDPNIINAEKKAKESEIKAAQDAKKLADEKLKAAQKIKEGEISLMSLIEAEEEAPKEEEENPFEKAAEETPADDKAPADGEEKEDDKKTKSSEEKEDKSLSVNFNINSVKKYNDGLFRSNTGTVKKITKDGLTVQVLPDDVEVFVNFSDITEAARRFFKQKK
jgi:hypothetical protein